MLNDVLITLLSIQFINAFYTLLTKHALTNSAPIDGYTFSLLRDLFATPFLFLASYVLEKDGGRLADDGKSTSSEEGAAAAERAEQQPPSSSVPYTKRIVIMSFLGVCCNQLFYILGLELTSASTAALLTQLNPVISLLLCAAIGTEQLTRQRVVGVCVAAFSAVLVVALPHTVGAATTAATATTVDEQPPGFFQRMLGATLLISCVTSNTLYFVMQKPLLRRIAPIRLTAMSYLVGFLLLGALVLARAALLGSGDLVRSLAALAPASPTAYMTWIAILFAALFNSVVKYALQSRVNRTVDVTVTALFGGLVPLLVVSIDCFVLGHAFEQRLLTGIGVLVGIYLVVSGGAAGGVGGGGGSASSSKLATSANAPASLNLSTWRAQLRRWLLLVD